MSPLSDALERPTKVVSSLYQRQDIDSFPAIVTAHFKSIFGTKGSFEQIPHLHHPQQSFPDGSLVLFNAMVQDTSLSPELYLAILKDGACGGWGISEDSAVEDRVHHERLRESNIFWAVSIPGLSSWCLGESWSRSSALHQSAQPHKFPLPDAPHIGIQLKIYDNRLAQPIRTTDIMSFVGILTSGSLHTSGDFQDPVSVPTLHVLFTVPLPNTVIPRAFPDMSLSSKVQMIRQELIQWMAHEALAGDLVASEWVFLSSLSRVRSRHPPVLPFSMTICGFPSPSEHSNSTPALYHVLSQIFPVVSLVPLSLETLNNMSFSPESKDEELHSGFLQHPKGSILLLTEGQMSEGEIFEKGVKNIRSTQEMMREQTLSYIFPYSRYQFETDINFLITTGGRKSAFFQTDINVPLRPILSGDLTKNLYKPLESIVLPSPDKLSLFRRLAGGSKIGHAVLGEELRKHIEEDFVRERFESTDRGVRKAPAFSPEDLVKRMVVARLIALSSHQEEVTIEDWERVKVLEKQIKIDV